MNDRTTYSTWMLSFLAGGLAGASIALLVAPQSGEATRRSIRRKLRDTAESAQRVKDRVVRRSEQLRDDATRRVSSAASALAGNGGASV